MVDMFSSVSNKFEDRCETIGAYYRSNAVLDNARHEIKRNLSFFAKLVKTKWAAANRTGERFDVQTEYG